MPATSSASSAADLPVATSPRSTWLTNSCSSPAALHQPSSADLNVQPGNTSGGRATGVTESCAFAAGRLGRGLGSRSSVRDAGADALLEHAAAIAIGSNQLV